MKIAISIFIILAAVNFSFAEKYPPDSAATSKSYNKYSKFEFFFLTGFALPVGAFGKDFEGNPYQGTESLLQKTIEGESGGFNAKSTFEVECGITFFLKPKATKTNFGIRTVLFSYAAFPFKWESDSDLIFDNAIYKSVRIISMRTGPVMRIYANNIQCDFFYQAGIAFGSHGSWNNSKQYDDFDGGLKYHFNDNADFKMNGGNGIMHEVGAAVSYRCLQAGFSFNFGSIKYNNVEFYRNVGVTVTGYQFYQSYSLYASDKLSAKAPVSYLKFFVGIRFGE